MCKLRHKVRNGQNIPRENEISSFSNLVFQIKYNIYRQKINKKVKIIKVKIKEETEKESRGVDVI